MSDTESDLDFESADEGLKGEDIDTSDLDIDDDEPQKQSPKATKNVADPKCSLNVDEEAKEPPSENKNLKDEHFEDNKPFENQGEKVIESKIKEINSGWEADANFSDIEEDNVVSKPVTVEVKHDKKVIENKIKEINSGWDADANFSDIEEGNVVSNKHQKPLKETGIENKIKNLSLFREEDSLNSVSGVSSWSGGWSSFSSILSTATSGISSVLETVEATIGAPDPTELAKITNKEETEKKESTDGWTEDNQSEVSKGQHEWFTMGNQIVNSGLGVLETVGRKTFKVISEKDQNLKQTREFLKKVPTVVSTQKPNLSQILREAQDSQTSATQNDKLEKQKHVNFQFYFEEFKGSSHLEALESLSRQSNVKLEVLPKAKANLKPTLTKLEELFDQAKLNDDEDSEEAKEDFFDNETFLNDFKLLIDKKKKTLDPEQFKTLIEKYAKRCCFNMDLEKIINSFKSACFSASEIESHQELMNESIKCFGLITSRTIELYHKTAESILLTEQNSANKALKSIENAELIYQITKLCIRSVTILAEDFCRKCRVCNEFREGQSNQILADIYLESSNASTYIGDAYLLLKPVFKTKILE